ncbi:MAG: c-type cytochrome [Gammaproteobacteria bacterium]
MKSCIKLLLCSLSFTVLLISLVNPLHANEYTELSETDDLIIQGQIEFQQSCAVCHGTDGKGDGPYPYSIALVFKPADLTKLMINNKGKFPFIETYLSIDGREINKYHGTRLMPIWGDRFSQESWSLVNPNFANTLVRGRIFELLLYIYSIQDTSF